MSLFPASMRKEIAPAPWLPVRPLVRRAALMARIPACAIEGKGRQRELIRVRQAVVLVALDLSARSTPEIGRAIGGRDHSTVINLRDGGIERYRREPEFRELVRALRCHALADPWGRQVDRVWAAHVRQLSRALAAEQRRLMAEIERRRDEYAEWRALLQPERCITANDLNGPPQMPLDELHRRRGEGERRHAAHAAHWLARENAPRRPRAILEMG